jgi:hypothetical protein
MVHLLLLWLIPLICILAGRFRPVNNLLAKVDDRHVMNFVAIDAETANIDMASISQI